MNSVHTKTNNTTETNKPGTAKVGAISKAQKARSFQNCDLLQNMKKNEELTFKKLRKNIKKQIFKQCHSAEKCKGGTNTCNEVLISTLL